DGVRDLDELNPPPSVAARGLTPRGTIKERLLHPVGSAIALGRVLIRAGDWIVCDRDGICVIPADAIESIAAGAEARIAKATSAGARITAGEPTRTVFDLKFAPLNAHGVRAGARSDRDPA